MTTEIIEPGYKSFTRDYDKFKFIKGNRPTNKRHIERLKASLQANNLLHHKPIIVNAEFEILDGQHRFLAAKDIGAEICFQIEENIKMEDIAILNQDNLSWNSDHFLNLHCHKGMKEYLKVREFRNVFCFTTDVCMSLLTGARNRHTNNFKKGIFVVRDWERAVKWAKMLYEFKPYYEGFKRRSFVFAMITVFQKKGYEHKRMIEKASYQQTKLVDCVNVATYLKLLEEIYNYRSSEKLRFIE